MSDSRVTVIAADDHRLFLEGVKSLLDSFNDIHLLSITNNGDNLFSSIKTYQPDIALIDISMPGKSINEIVIAAEKYYPNTRLLALTMFLDPELADDLFQLGLDGYLLKEDAFEELYPAIVAVRDNEQYISKTLLVEFDKYLKQGSVKAKLTEREEGVLVCAAYGKTNKEIARSLSISERTVRFHLSNCCLKLQAQGRSNAVAVALQQGLIKV